jgi:site-specific recombinase XerD
MSTELTTWGQSPHAGLGPTAEITDRARNYINQSKSANTVRAYRSDWKQFSAWCHSHGQVSLPASPDCVALYLADRAETNKPATLSRHVAAISQAHQIAGFDASTRSSKVRLVMAGIRRTKGAVQVGKNPVIVEELRRIVEVLPDNLLGVRDRAILLLGFAGAFRRSELVQLDYDAVQFTREGLVVKIRRSKTDQEGEGQRIGIPYGSNPDTCPVRSLRDWLDRSGINAGPLFRPINRHGQISSRRLSGAGVAEIVKRYVRPLGLDAAKYGAHSLRAGLATAAAMAGASERAIMNQTRHRSVTTLRRYIRDGSLFRENAAALVGL